MARASTPNGIWSPWKSSTAASRCASVDSRSSRPLIASRKSCRECTPTSRSAPGLTTLSSKLSAAPIWRPGHPAPEPRARARERGGRPCAADRHSIRAPCRRAWLPAAGRLRRIEPRCSHCSAPAVFQAGPADDFVPEIACDLLRAVVPEQEISFEVQQVNSRAKVFQNVPIDLAIENQRHSVSQFLLDTLCVLGGSEEKKAGGPAAL